MWDTAERKDVRTGRSCMLYASVQSVLKTFFRSTNIYRDARTDTRVSVCKLCVTVAGLNENRTVSRAVSKTRFADLTQFTSLFCDCYRGTDKNGDGSRRIRAFRSVDRPRRFVIWLWWCRESGLRPLFVDVVWTEMWRHYSDGNLLLFRRNLQPTVNMQLRYTTQTVLYTVCVIFL
jgi:hypothetical protein